MTELRGIVFDLKKFAVHDGPGLRTTVFFKGCPLNCLWCHNPESQLLRPEKNPQQNFMHKFDKILSGSKDTIGSEVTVDELMYEIEKDIIFYDESGGGVTFSGGEPLMQPVFLLNVLKECKNKSIHTALDTTGYVHFKIFEQIYEYVDLFLFDLKLFDDIEHKKYTGVSNKLIIENLKNLASLGNKVAVRIPLIPGITDTKINLLNSAELISNLKNIREVNLLPYNPLVENKYKRYGKENLFPGLRIQSPEELKKIQNIFSELKNTAVRVEG